MQRSRRKANAAELRTKLGHPVIDGDGHVTEAQPVVIDYIKQVAGARLAQRYHKLMTTGGGPWGWNAQSERQRADRRTIRPPFWGQNASNTLDRATALFPNLMRERLDEFGIDFTIVYTSIGLPMFSLADDELRRGVCRALNVMYADLYSSHRARMTPAAVIPMFTPDEAIEEAEYAVNTLGFKAVMIAGGVKRPVPIVARNAPKMAPYASFIDSLAIDSPYDYDPVWAKFVELKVAPTSHNNSMGWGARVSTTNYNFNHIGHFAAAGESFAKALILGGVMRRFPNLRFGFLEGGVAWASNLYNDLVEHWEKRNIKALRTRLDPALIDHAALAKLRDRWGGEIARRMKGTKILTHSMTTEDPRFIDDFAAAGIERAEDFRDIFASRCYFGCETDDRLVAVAFNPKLNHFGLRLNAMFSSDLSHWDVPEMTEVLPQAWELVEEELITEDDFRDFTFGNAARLHAGMNPAFFEGTVVADAVRHELGLSKAQPAAAELRREPPLL